VAKNLPPRPNLDHLRSQAKALLAALQSGDADAITTIRTHLPAANGMTEEQIRKTPFRLADAQSAVARKTGFASWPQLGRHVEQLRALEGTWAFAHLEIDGQLIPSHTLTASRILIDGDRFRTESPEATYEGIFNINVEADPHEIDIDFIAGPEAGNRNFGIFRLDGDGLEICLDMNGKTRPTAFRSTGGAGRAFERLTRVSDARPDNVTGGAPPLCDDAQRAGGGSMEFETPKVSSGSGEHPVALVVVSAKNLAAASAFYSKLFGWQVHPMSAELASAVPPAGPIAALRSNAPAGFPGIVPYIAVRDVDAMLGRVVAAGGTAERAARSVPGVGKLALFKDPTGTIYGLADSAVARRTPPMPMPVGSNPKPPAGAICHLEMYAADGDAAARFFTDLFGWGTLPTMPQYVAFDPGAGPGGVFQSHTPSLPAVAYIYTADVGAKLAEIEAAGGKRMGEPMRLPGAGCIGYFVDPSGISMGLIGP
jgi:uncharacterized protein (TIGR03067 family)